MGGGSQPTGGMANLLISRDGREVKSVVWHQKRDKAHVTSETLKLPGNYHTNPSVPKARLER